MAVDRMDFASTGYDNDGFVIIAHARAGQPNYPPLLPFPCVGMFKCCAELLAEEGSGNFHGSLFIDSFCTIVALLA